MTLYEMNTDKKKYDVITLWEVLKSFGIIKLTSAFVLKVILIVNQYEQNYTGDDILMYQQLDLIEKFFFLFLLHILHEIFVTEETPQIHTNTQIHTHTHTYT